VLNASRKYLENLQLVRYIVLHETFSLYFIKADNDEILCFHEFEEDPNTGKIIINSIDDDVLIALKGNYSVEKHQRFPIIFEHFTFESYDFDDVFEIDCIGMEYFKVKRSINNIFKFASYLNTDNWYYVHQIEEKHALGKSQFILVLMSLKYEIFEFFLWDQLPGDIFQGNILVLNNHKNPTGFYKVNTSFRPNVSMPRFILSDNYICIKTMFDYGEDLIGVHKLIK